MMKKDQCSLKKSHIQLIFFFSLGFFFVFILLLTSIYWYPYQGWDDIAISILSFFIFLIGILLFIIYIILLKRRRVQCKKMENL